MSREIIAFSLFASMAMPAATAPMIAPQFQQWAEVLRVLAGIAGFVAVFCSGMLYHDTGRPTWLGWRSVGRFVLTAFLLGSGSALVLAVGLGLPAAGWSMAVIVAACLKLALELVCLLPSKSFRVEAGEESAVAVSARLQWSSLRWLTWSRLGAGAVGGALMSVVGGHRPSLIVASLCLGLLLLSEGGERYSFFRCSAHTCPVCSMRTSWPRSPPRSSPRRWLARCSSVA